MSIRDVFGYLCNIYELAAGISRSDSIPLTEIKGENPAGDAVNGMKVNDDGSINVGVTIKQSDIQLPTDIQSHYQQIIPTHNAVSIDAGLSSAGNWENCNGFDKVVATILNDVDALHRFDIAWSYDGVNIHSLESQQVSAENQKPVEISIKAPYIKLIITNEDSVTHTFSGWLMLKA